MPRLIQKKEYMTVSEVGSFADALYQMRDEERHQWEDRIARLDLQDRITWEAMCAGMTREAIGEYVSQYIPSLVGFKDFGNSCVRRLVRNINVQIGIERGEHV